MPQCIVQQNQSAWLSAMTACTWKRCTRHFGLICSHHQYLTQLSCLRAGFSSDLVGEYLPYCSRSVLAKAQFYHWILQVTGRTWFIDVGDAINVQRLSPASLVNGYAHIDVVGKAPSCLARADSASSKEPFGRIIASCSFTSMTQHTGNAIRPWEYNPGLQSMTTLDSETAAYTLTQYSVAHGDYFDRACFCKTFTIGRQEEPCAAPRRLEMTRERLWMNATCGPKSLFSNWTDNLMTTESAYIAKEASTSLYRRCLQDRLQRLLQDNKRNRPIVLLPSNLVRVLRRVMPFLRTPYQLRQVDAPPLRRCGRLARLAAGLAETRSPYSPGHDSVAMEYHAIRIYGR
jgi:hypothetical protein